MGKSDRMDPSRKRAIRLTVALTAAVLLASALIFVSFASGAEEVTASQLLRVGRPGQSYVLAGSVVYSSVRHQGTDAAVPDPRPEAARLRARPLLRDRAGPVRRGPGGDGDRPGGAGRLHVRRSGELADDQVPVQVPGPSGS